MLKVQGRYLFEESKPFFWLADTAWLLAENLSADEIEVYLKNRADLGFNVIQLVLYYKLPNQMKIESEMPVEGKDTSSEGYLQMVKHVFKRAKDYGMYVALAPFWGSFVKKGVYGVEDVERLSSFLVDTFGGNENLIWILGGDVKGDVNHPFFSLLGQKIKNKDHNRHLMTFHPFGRTHSAIWFNDEEWLDFNMFQSGHRRYDQMKMNAWDDVPEKWYGEDNWRYVDDNMSYAHVKPCLDAEPSYENIVQGLHDANQPYWVAKDVRRYAYWSVFQGACGFTYGHNAIIQFYTPKLGKGAYGVKETWQEALSAEGATQMQFLKKLMESVPYYLGRDREDLLVGGQKEKYSRISVFGGPGFLFAYDYLGGEFSLSLEPYEKKEMEAYWMNPQNGVLTYFGSLTGLKQSAFRPTKRTEGSNDWVLALKEKVNK